MSTRTYQTHWRGQIVDVMTGWDPRLQRHFLVIEGDHGLLQASDLTPTFPGLVIDEGLAQERIIYSNLNEPFTPGGPDPDLIYFLALLGFLGLRFPPSLSSDLEEDARKNLGNAEFCYGVLAETPAAEKPFATQVLFKAGLLVYRRFASLPEERAYMLGVNDARGHYFSNELDVDGDSRTLYVVARPLVDPADLHSDDLDVSGRYAIEVLTDPDEGMVASAVLDGFHETIPVKNLDDFAITVEDANGKQLLPGDYPGYTLGAMVLCVAKMSGERDQDDDHVPRWVDRHSVNCKVCAETVDERVCAVGLQGEGDICPQCIERATRIRIESGQALVRQADGSWTDGQRVYVSLGDVPGPFDVLEVR